MSPATRLAPCFLPVLLLAAQCSASPVPPQEKLLLPQSTRQYSMIPYHVGPCGWCTVEQPWVSDHELLHIGADGLLYRLDTTNKEDVALPELTKEVADSAGSSYSSLAVSPDGNWVLWTSKSNTVCAAQIKGGNMLSWPGSEFRSRQYWCADSRHIIRLPWNYSKPDDPPGLVHEYSVDVPDQTTVFSIPEDAANHWLNLRTQDMLLVTSDDNIISSYVGGFHDWIHTGGQKYPQTISTWSLRKNAHLKSWTILLPTMPKGVAVSRQGGRIVSIVDSDDEQYEELLVCNIDGTHQREVGRIKDIKEGDEIKNYLCGVAWSPDGKTVSFVCGDEFWTVPVD